MSVPHEHPHPGSSHSPNQQRIYGDGEMAKRIRAHDWGSTSLGPLEGWSDALVVLVNALLANQLQMFLFWGEELVQFYNDQSISILGPEKHPAALGQPAAECWAEIWEMTGPQLRSAMQGHAVRNEDQYTPIYRFGKIDEAWFTYCYSPARDIDGVIRGVVVTTLETTPRFRAERALERERLERLFCRVQRARAGAAAVAVSAVARVFRSAARPKSRFRDGKPALHATCGRARGAGKARGGSDSGGGPARLRAHSRPRSGNGGAFRRS